MTGARGPETGHVRANERRTEPFFVGPAYRRTAAGGSGQQDQQRSVYLNLI